MRSREKRMDRPVRFMTAQEISKFLRLHPSTIYRLVKTGRFPGVKVGDSWRFDVQRVTRWLAETGQESKSE